jgi:hypothetical protein
MSSVPTSMTPSAPICFLSKARLHCSTWAIGSQATARQTVRGGTTALVARRLAAERAVSRGGCLSAQSSSAGYNPAPAGGPSQICCTGRADHAHASRQYETIRMSRTLVRGQHQQTAMPYCRQMVGLSPRIGGLASTSSCVPSAVGLEQASMPRNFLRRLWRGAKDSA